MGKELKTFLQRKLNNQQAHEKMFNIISQEGNTYQNHEISYHTYIKRLTYSVAEETTQLVGIYNTSHFRKKKVSQKVKETP